MQRLDSLKDVVEGQSVYITMKYNLLRTRLQDKSDIMPTSDSLMKGVHAYFEKNGSAAEKMEARYYMASIYRDLNDMPRALTYFLKAYEVAEDGATVDTVLWENTCSQLASIYVRFGEFSQAVKYAKMEYEFRKSKGTLDPISYMDMATPYYCMGDTATALKYYEMALFDILRSHTENQYADILAECLLTYTKCKDSVTAEKCYQILRDIPAEKRAYNQDVACAEYAFRFVSPDSAIPYAYNVWKNGGTWSHKCAGAGQLMKCYEKKRLYKETSHWALLFEEANDSLIELSHEELTKKAHISYYYYRNKAAEQEAYLKAQRSEMKMYAGLGVSLLVLLCLSTSFFYYKKRMAERLLRKDREISVTRTSLNAKEEELRESTRLIERKEAELAEKSARNASLDEQLRELEAELTSKIQQNSLLTRLQLRMRLAEEAPMVVEKFRRAADIGRVPTEAEWVELQTAVEQLHPGLHETLVKTFRRFTPAVLRAANLAAAGMTSRQIESLTGMSRTTIWRTIRKVGSVVEIPPNFPS